MHGKRVGAYGGVPVPECLDDCETPTGKLVSNMNSGKVMSQ